MLRNTEKHSGARNARITLDHLAGRVAMEVRDDGCGFDPAVLDRRIQDGHFGLNLLRDLVDDAGGFLDVEASPGEGTSVRVGSVRMRQPDWRSNCARPPCARTTHP